MGTEKAARVADMMQTVARLLVLVIIIPTAIWLAVFSLLAGVIPDSIVRGLFSLTFGLGLAGMIVARMRYPVRGSILTALAALAGAVSLAIFWNQLFVTLAIIHIFLITLLGIFRYLRIKLEISFFRWLKIRSILALVIIASAPLPVILYLSAMGCTSMLLVTIASIMVWFYTLGTQYLLRESRLGILNSALPAFGTSLLLLEGHLIVDPFSGPLVIASVFLLGLGVCTLVTSQVFRFVQQSITMRPVKALATEMRREELLRSVGIEIESEKQITQQTSPEDTIWVINQNHAQMLSGIALLVLASGIPAYFMWMVGATPWATENFFIFLFVPLALLIPLLISVPAPVLFRLAGVIKRSQESRIVKSLGFLIVTIASFGLFTWMQFYLISLAIPASILLFISGLTGIFKEIRLLWRAAWNRITVTAKRVWGWIRRHYIGAGIIADAIITTSVMLFILYPFSISNSLHSPFLFLGSTGLLVFTILGLLGVSGIKTNPRKHVFATGGFGILLLCFSSLTFWYYSVNNDLISAASAASIWFLGFALLQVLKVSRKALAFPFFVGFLGLAVNIYFFELQTSTNPIPVLSIVSLLLVSSAMLHSEYNRAFTAFVHAMTIAGAKVSRVLRRIGGAVKDALIRIGTAIRLGLIRIGGAIYRAGVWLGVQIVRFILVLYAFVLVYLIGQFGLGFIAVTPNVDLLYVFSGLTFLFFILFTPSLYAKGIRKGRALLACIIIISITLGFFVFSLTSGASIFVRVPFSAFVTLSLVSSVRNRMHPKVQEGLPYLAWTSFVIWLAAYTYLVYLPDTVFAVMMSSFIAGVGFLPLRINKRLTPLSTLLYILLCVPSGAIAIYLLTSSNILWTISALLLLPAVVFYSQYALALAAAGHALYAAGVFVMSGLRYVGGRILSGARYVGRRIMAGIRAFGMYIKRGIYRIGTAIAMTFRYLLLVMAAHILLFAGILSIGLSFLILYIMLPTIQLLIFWEVQLILDFLMLMGIFLLPTLFVRRADHSRILSSVVASLAISIGGISYLAFLSDLGIVSAFLLAVSFTSMIFGIGIPNLVQRKVPVFVSLVSIQFFILNILAMDLLITLTITVVGLSFLSVPFLSTTNRWRIAYPIITTTVFGFFFYSVVLLFVDPLLTLTGFILMDALFLMLPPETRSWQIWWAFCFASGYFIYSLFSALLLEGIVSYLQFVLPIFIVIELLRLTPDIEYRFTEYSEYLGILRAVLLSLALFVLLPTESLIISAEITILVFSLIMTWSLWKEVTDRTRFAMINMLAASFSLLTGSYLIIIRNLDILISYYFAVIPLFLSLIYSTYESTDKDRYWLISRGLLIVTFSLVWFTGYRTFESLILGLPTAFFIVSLLSSGTPWSGLSQQGFSKAFCLSTVILVESIWIWHAILVFLIPFPQFLIVSSLLLMSSIVFPLTKNQTWIDFELVWDCISILTAISLGAFLSGWNLSSLSFPANPLLSLGWGFSIFSLMSGSMIRYNEASQGEPASERISHMAWLLSIPGWALLGFSYGLMFLQPEFVAGTTMLCFSAASIIYALVHPQPTRNLHLAINLVVSLSISYLAWVWLQGVSPVERMIGILSIWMILEVPTLGSYYYAGLVRTYAAMKMNSVNLALVLPVIVGIWFGSTFLFQASCPLLLGLDIRPCFQAISVTAVSIGALYFFEGLFFNGTISERVRVPSVALLGRGVLILLLSYTLPEAFPDLVLVAYLLTGSVTFSLITMSTLNVIFGFKKAAQRTWMFAGLVLLPASYLGLVRYASFTPTLALVSAVVLSFFMETPFLRSQIAAAIALMTKVANAFAQAIRNLGATISKAVRRFALAVRVFFERFGYINWVAFSLIFTTGLSYFSGSFFSDLLGMNQLGPVYWIPRVSMPVLLLGLLLLTVAIIRRTVKSTFGVSCVLVALGGATLTGTTWLFDQGFLLLSAAVGVILISFGTLTFLFERKAETKRISMIWVPIPISIGFVIISFLGTSIMALSLASMFASLILLLSTFTRLLQESLRGRLWVLTAGTSGIATYTIAAVAFLPLASLYLAVFIASLVLFPVTFNVSKYLFAAPLFFAITGYAFTSLMGEFLQGLALAMSPFLLFMALFIKEHESERPKLAYLRLVLLLILLGSIVVFGISMIPLIM